MRRVVLALAIVLGCDRHDAPAPEREAKSSGVKFDDAAKAELSASSAPTPEAKAEIVEPAPVRAAPSGNADAVLAIFAGEIEAARLPLVDVDPGHAFEPGLRDTVAPRVVRTRGGAAVPTVKMSPPTVSGSLDKDIVRRIVRAHINEVRHCYNQTLVVDEKLRGELEMTFAVTPAGATDKVAVSSSTLPGPLGKRMGECTTKAIRRWKFPAPPDGKPVAVTFPFALAPA
ncbi:MAG TPA: AgmX/PglI C-terminal domain-containing protein, partial [Nannocystaceae bacterium]|nr:AgmX/PglI C-terminal domain-containing protein [Nannocystaceae bacterium]